jgi:NAD(P)-dependent dehydrogenase (short-subunit alcohol dehydrogenase family)
MPNILITGGTRGIGLATALLAAQREWSVAINFASNSNTASQAAAAIERLGQQVIALQGDVSKEEDVLRVFDGAIERFGHLDAVVINAGIVGPSMPLAEMDGERLQRMVAVNTLGALFCAREAIRWMSRSRGGRGGSIVLVSSMAAKLGSPFEYVDYAASKGALDTLTVGLAKEVGPEGIRVNAVRPGLITTDIHASGGRPDRAIELGTQTPLGRPGTPEEVAAAILWLIGPEASYTNGALVDIAGGR